MFSIPYSRYVFYPVSWYSFLIVIGAALAIYLASRQENRNGLKKDTVIDLSLWLLPFGIIGARIYYVIFAWDEFSSDPLSVFRIWEGGIAIYGAIITGVIVLVVFCRVRKLPVLLLCDLIAPGLALAQSIGRWGNYFNMEAYGPEVTNPMLCFFPFCVQIPYAGGSKWHMAAFFYESVLDFGIFCFLILARKKLLKKQGDVFFFYLFLYAAGRLIIEELRTDSLYAAPTVRISQLISILLCLIVLFRYLCLYRKHSQHLAVPSAIIAVFSFLLCGFILYFSVCKGISFDISLQGCLIVLFSYSCLMSIFFFFTYLQARKADENYAYDKT